MIEGAGNVLPASSADSHTPTPSERLRALQGSNGEGAGAPRGAEASLRLQKLMDRNAGGKLAGMPPLTPAVGVQDGVSGGRGGESELSGPKRSQASPRRSPRFTFL